MQNLYEELKTLLSDQPQYIKDGKPFKNKIVEDALHLDAALIRILLTHEKLKKHFFQDVDGMLIFDKLKFQRFVQNKQFLPDSYTQFKNKIGLTTDREYLTESREVVLSWAYKDCVLEGGQTKEEQKRKEIFWNETLAPDEIDRLFEPKALTNWKKYDQDGEHQLNEPNLNDNLIIKGNNLLALHSLKKIYASKVKLIYIDPPYNTGNDGFDYNDSFNHSTWLTFMKNRLEIARTFLSKDGTIAISIDQKEIAYILPLLDEIFKAENRKNIITVKRGSVTGAKVINPGVVNISEYVVIYSKNATHWKPNRVFRQKERDNRYNKIIVNYDAPYEKWEFDSLLDRFALANGVPKSKLRKHLGEQYDKKLYAFIIENKGKVIRFASLDDKSISSAALELKYQSKGDKSKVYFLEREDGRPYYVFNGELILFVKDRLTEIDGELSFSELISDIWNDVLPNDLHNEGGISLRKGKKPEKLISRIIELCTNENDIVMDFFVGSGTTGAVALKKKRQFIVCEQLEYTETLPLKRMQNTVNGEQSGISKSINWQGGGSFVYAELMQDNQRFINAIAQGDTSEQLKAIWQDIQENGFISYLVNPKEIDKEIADFEALSLEHQKQFLVEILDKNLLYVNYHDLENGDYQISDADKALNRKFYNLK